MKKVLITGANSYIGNSICNWLKYLSDPYVVDILDVTDKNWENHSFLGYDCIINVAGIAHRRITKKNKNLYFDVNAFLAEKIAKKAKAAGVPHHIFLSSMSVFGNPARIGKKKNILLDTLPSPTNVYGESKLKAEQLLSKLEGPDFKVAIVRPPMVYGKNAKGNYPLLSKLAKKVFIFPNIKNQKSVMYIDNLSNFIYLLVKNADCGFFHPQNTDIISTSEIVHKIASVHSKKIYFTRFFNPFIYLLSFFVNFINKIFGNMTYDLESSKYYVDYCVVSFEDSIKNTEV